MVSAFCQERTRPRSTKKKGARCGVRQVFGEGNRHTFTKRRRIKLKPFIRLVSEIQKELTRAQLLYFHSRSEKQELDLFDFYLQKVVVEHASNDASSVSVALVAAHHREWLGA